MSANDLYRAGKLQQAIDEQTQVVKASPGDQAKRLFLFELLAFAGDLDRAKRQIEAVHYSEMELETAVLGYRRLMDAEEMRRRVFREAVMPQFLVPPPEHVGKRLQAVAQLKDGNLAETAKLLAEADAMTAPVTGTLNKKPFTALRDADDLFGPILEVMAQGAYYWVPLEQIDALGANEPKVPRDLIWFPANISMRDGPSGDVFLPALYPGSHEHADDQVRLGRMTDWKTPEGGPVQGVGLRVFLAGEDGVNLPDWRELQILS